MTAYKWTHRKFSDLPGPGDIDPPEPDELADEDDAETDDDTTEEE
jgi:hypothetical protein